jgi:type I site-specific restriction-modification system R (restriction) subunit
MAGPEYTDVEKPFIDQLVEQRWEHLAGSVDDPAVTHRTSFAQVVMEPILRERLHAINRRDGEPWLDERRLDQAVSAMTRLPASKVMEANKLATELLLTGLAVEGLEGWDGGRGQMLRYIDWETPANNAFHVVNQFKVKCPPGHDTGKGHVIPDLVLFVNGIPLVVECKSRTVPEGLPLAVDQLRRYHDQRHLDFEVEEHEGAPALFATCQFLVASNFDEARVGTIGAGFAHYLSWKTVAPMREAEVAIDLGVADLSAQQRLVAGMLTRENLLDILRHYTLFINLGGQDIKLVSLPAVQRRHPRRGAAQDRQDPAPGRRGRPTRRHRLAHPGQRQEPLHGVPGAQAAHRPRPTPLQGSGHHRPQGPADPALRHRRAHRRKRREGEQHRRAQEAAGARRSGAGVRHGAEISRTEGSRSGSRQRVGHQR